MTGRRSALLRYSILSIVVSLLLATPTAGAEPRTANEAPAPRYGTRLAYDAATRQVVMFGGYDGYTIFGDTWMWDGTAWTQQHPANAPAPRYGFGMAYDAARKQVVLFGGSTYTSDTWTWEGSTWTEQHPAHSPPGGSPLSLAYDVATQQIVLWVVDSQIRGQTWTWDGVDWTQQLTRTTPPWWDSYRMAYDGATQQVVLFGGSSCGDLGCEFNRSTWTWNGGTWTKQHPIHSPAGREAPGLAYDQATRQFILFGGYSWGGYQNDTLQWNDVTWTRLDPGASPEPRESMGIAYDVARRQIVMFGGLAALVYGDTWVWDGANWSRR